MKRRTSHPLPVELVHRFWDEVERQLRSRHRLGGDQAVRSILRYRNEVERIGPILYHREPGDLADDIVSGGYAQAGRKVG